MLSQDEIFKQVANRTISRLQALELLKNINEKKQAAAELNQYADNIKVIVNVLSDILHIEKSEINTELSFKEIGVDSISGLEIVTAINNQYDLNLDAVILYDYPSIHDFAAYLENTVLQQHSYKETIQAGDNLEKQERVIQNQDIADVKLRDKIKQAVESSICRILHIPGSALEDEMNFKDLGVDSVNGLEIVRDINKEFELNLDAVILYDYPDTDQLSDYIENLVRDALGQSIPWTTEKLQEKQPNAYDDENYFNLRRDYIKNNDKRKEKDHHNPGGNKVALKRVEKKNNTNSEMIQKDPVVQKGVNAQDPMQGIAVIGMSGKFPKAENVKEFWENIREGRNCIGEFPVERYGRAGFENSSISHFNMGKIEGISHFDPLYFNISPVEAEVMDPQQRLFLQECLHAIEDAGCSEKEMYGKKCGVFAGTTMGEYQNIISSADPANKGDIFTGVSPSILPARISYYLNLTGPSIALDTACSSSLVAVHEACKSIKAGDCDMALAGGIRLMLTPDLLIQTMNAGMMSPTGYCRAFDQRADGIVLGEAAGVIVLKEWKKAVEDGDYIYGIIKSSGVNQDGRTNGITAPSSRSQVLLEQEVYRNGNINPEDITLIEAHGTGTKLGDPIEVKALKEVFSKYIGKAGRCAIGSVKNNIGHTTMAAGICSVIKVLLAIKNKQIPPHIHYEQLNEHISLEDSPFYINKTIKEWKTEGNKPRMAAVSSFGFSGTNCHLVIEEAR